GGARARARPRRRGAGLLAGEDRERSERGDEAPDGDRVRAPRPDLHRRPLRPELPPHPGARLELRLLVGLGLDRRYVDPADPLLPLEEVDLARTSRPLALPDERELVGHSAMRAQPELGLE